MGDSGFGFPSLRAEQRTINRDCKVKPIWNQNQTQMRSQYDPFCEERRGEVRKNRKGHVRKGEENWRGEMMELAHTRNNPPLIKPCPPPSVPTMGYSPM